MATRFLKEILKYLLHRHNPIGKVIASVRTLPEDFLHQKGEEKKQCTECSRILFLEFLQARLLNYKIRNEQQQSAKQ